jgi:hypothetical protein
LEIRLRVSGASEFIYLSRCDDVINHILSRLGVLEKPKTIGVALNKANTSGIRGRDEDDDDPFDLDD